MHPFDRFSRHLGAYLAALIVGGPVVAAAQAQPERPMPPAVSAAVATASPAQAALDAAALLRERVDWDRASPDEQRLLLQAMNQLVGLAQSLERQRDRRADRSERRDSATADAAKP